MRIAVNIGNTNTAVSLDGNNFSVPTNSYQHSRELFNIFCQRIPKHKSVRGTMASVVPEKTEIVQEALCQFCGAPPVVVTSRSRLGVNLTHYNLSLVGVDRLIACFEALRSYQPPLVVFDLGTATTANVVGSQREFLGGAILPGMQTMLDSLETRTSLLPRVMVGGVTQLIGNNTQACLLTGAIYSTIGFIEKYRDVLREELGATMPAVITGGNAAVVLENGLEGCHYEPDLILRGLLHITNES